MAASFQAEDFDVAKAVYDQLKDLPADRQQVVLRLVGEALGRPVASSTSPPGGAQTAQAHASNVPPPEESSQPGSAKDIKTFIAAKSPKSDTQFAAAVAYFYRFEAAPAEKRDSITADILQESTRLAGRRRLASPLKTLNNAKAAGYLDSPARGEFTVNSVGENLVAMTLPGGSTDPRPRKPRAKKPKAPAKATKRKSAR